MNTKIHYLVSLDNLLFLIIVLFFLHIQVNAQVFAGVEVGGISANLTTPNDLGEGVAWNYHYGFSAGTFIDIPLGESIGLRPTLQYIQKGLNADVSVMGWKAAITNSYIELPVNVRYELSCNPLRLFFIGGPTIGYLVSSKAEITFDQAGSDAVNTKDMYKSYDVTINIGVGVEYQISPNLILIPTLRYYHGIVKVDTPVSGESQSYSRTFQLSIGVMMPIAK